MVCHRPSSFRVLFLTNCTLFYPHNVFLLVTLSASLSSPSLFFNFTGLVFLFGTLEAVDLTELFELRGGFPDLGARVGASEALSSAAVGDFWLIDFASLRRRGVLGAVGGLEPLSERNFFSRTDGNDGTLASDFFEAVSFEVDGRILFDFLLLLLFTPFRTSSFCPGIACREYMACSRLLLEARYLSWRYLEGIDPACVLPITETTSAPGAKLTLVVDVRTDCASFQSVGFFSTDRGG